MNRSCSVVVVVCWLTVAVSAFAGEPFEPKDGDRVVLLGGTFIEREGNHGYIETVLTTARPDRTIVFRNLGWSGDTVWTNSRGLFDPPVEGYKRMIALIAELQPTVIFLAYGTNESFVSEPGNKAVEIAQFDPLVEKAEKEIVELLKP